MVIHYLAHFIHTICSRFGDFILGPRHPFRKHGRATDWGLDVYSVQYCRRNATRLRSRNQRVTPHVRDMRATGPPGPAISWGFYDIDLVTGNREHSGLDRGS